MSEPLVEETYLPGEEDAESLAKVYDFLAAHESVRGAAPIPRYFLSGAEQGDQVELPEELHRALVQVVQALRSGLAVNIAPKATRLTTQEAADLIGVSRPTLVTYLEAGLIAYSRVGTHRRIFLDDVLAFKEQRKQAQYAALAEIYSGDSDASSAVTSQRLKSVRKSVASQRLAQDK